MSRSRIGPYRDLKNDVAVMFGSLVGVSPMVKGSFYFRQILPDPSRRSNTLLLDFSDTDKDTVPHFCIQLIICRGDDERG